MAGKVFEIAFAINGAMAQSFKTSMQQAKGMMSDYGRKIKELKTQQKALDAALKDGVISMDSYRNATAQVGKALEETAAKDAKLRKSMQKKVAADADRSNARSDFGKTMMTAGVVAAPFIGAIAKAAEFESVMAKVKAITVSDDATMQQLTSTARELGEKTMFSATQSAEAMTYLGMAGWNANQIIAGMPGLLDLAAAGGTDLARTADIVSDNLTAFGLDASQSTHMADVFAVTISKTNTNVEMLGETMKYAAPVAKAFGVSMEETSALAGMMANSGIKASQAGTALRSGFLRLSGTSSKSTKAMDEMGLSVSEATAQQLEAKAALESLDIAMNDTEGPRKMGAIVRDLAEKTKYMGKEQKLATIGAIFGTNAASAWVSVLDQGPDVLDKLTGELENSDGAAKQMAETMQATAQGSLVRLQSATESVAISIGATMLPTLADMGDALADGAAWLAKVAGEHPVLVEWTIKLGAAVMGMVIAYKATKFIYYEIMALKEAYVLLTNTERLATLRAAFAQGVLRAKMMAAAIWAKGLAVAQWALNLAMSANPIALVVIAVIALIGVFVLLYNYAEEIRAFFVSLWESPTVAVLAFLGGPVGWLIYATIGIIANWEKVKEWFVLLWEDPKTALSQFVDWIYSKLGGVFNWIGEKWDWVKSVFSSPIHANVQASATANGQKVQIAANARGGIYGKGAFLTTFAEESPEAAIPLDGSARAKSLWTKTGEMMGMLPASNSSSVAVNAPINITIAGNADANTIKKVQDVVVAAVDDLESRIAAIQRRKQRVSFG